MRRTAQTRQLQRACMLSVSSLGKYMIWKVKTSSHTLYDVARGIISSCKCAEQSLQPIINQVWWHYCCNIKPALTLDYKDKYSKKSCFLFQSCMPNVVQDLTLKYSSDNICTVGFFSLLWNQGLNLEGLGLVKIPVGFINIVAGEKIKLTLYLPE